jgi:mono/diheme cytochrome c family protein
VKELMKDQNPRMRAVALWVSESLYKAGDQSFNKDYLSLMNDKDTQVKMRAMMTGRLLKIPGTEAAVKKVMAADTTAGIQLVGKQVLEPPIVNSFFGRSRPNLNEEEAAMVDEGARMYSSLCATCHGPLGHGTPAGPGKLLAPSLVGSTRVQAHPDYVTKVLLRGLTGEIQKESYAGVLMTPMSGNDDKWIASVASYIRLNFENESGLITTEDVARVRKETADQKTPYTFDALWGSVPQALDPNSGWKVTASHAAETRKGSTASAFGATNFEGWTTGITQKAGMWFQVELPEATTLREIQFLSPPISRGWRQGSPPPIHTYPREFDIAVSMDGQQWTPIVTKGQGSKASMAIRFDAVKTKFLKITLTKSEEIVHGERRGKPFDFEVVWAMREFRLFGM